MTQANRNLLLAGIVIAVLAIVSVYRWSSSAEDDGLREVTLFDRQMTWRCLGCGQVSTDLGAPGPKTCTACNKELLYVSEDWGCPKHGVFKVAVKFDKKAKPAEFKYGDDGEWVSALGEDGEPARICPKCGEYLVPPQGLPPG